MRNKDVPLVSNLPPPDPHTTEKHKRETLLQIILPALVGFLLLASCLVLVVTPGSTVSRTGADVALIFIMLLLLLPLLLIGLVFAAVLFGVWKIYHLLPPYMKILQGVGALIQQRTRFYADKAAAPFIIMKSWQAALQECTHQVSKPFRQR
jgi:hypothetical protein